MWYREVFAEISTVTRSYLQVVCRAKTAQLIVLIFFFLNDPAPPEIYPLPLHAALPISLRARHEFRRGARAPGLARRREQRGRLDHGSEPLRRRVERTVPESRRLRRRDGLHAPLSRTRSEEHTSELQSRLHLVCRLLLEK